VLHVPASRVVPAALFGQTQSRICGMSSPCSRTQRECSISESRNSWLTWAAAIGVRWQIDADDVGLLVGDEIDKAGILVAEAVDN
jgi:hypothetical protein